MELFLQVQNPEIYHFWIKFCKTDVTLLVLFRSDGHYFFPMETILDFDVYFYSFEKGMCLLPTLKIQVIKVLCQHRMSIEIFIHFFEKCLQG